MDNKTAEPITRNSKSMAEPVFVKQEPELQEDVPSLDSPETQQVDAGPLGLLLPVKLEPDTDDFIKQEIEIGPTEFYKPILFSASQFEEPVMEEAIQPDCTALTDNNKHDSNPLPRILIKKITNNKHENNPPLRILIKKLTDNKHENNPPPRILIKKITDNKHNNNPPSRILIKKLTDNKLQQNPPPRILIKKITNNKHENNPPSRILINIRTELQGLQNGVLPIHTNKNSYICKGTINKQTRKLIYSVYRYMEKESHEGVYNVKQILRRTSEATNASLYTIGRIVKEGNTEETFKTPGKKRRGSRRITGLNEFYQCLIKRLIHTFHRTYKTLLTINELLLKVREDINYQGSEGSLRNITRSLGFRWKKKTKTNKKVLIEKNSIRLKRIEYIQEIRKYRQQGRPIIYTDRLYVHASYAMSKTQFGKTLLELKQPVSQGQYAIIVHAGSEAGFVPNSLLSFKFDSKSGDNRGELSVSNYDKWLKTHLIPNVPPNAVIVVDNAPYYSKQYGAALTSSSKKSEMISWLTEKGINFDSQMLKPQLYHLIKSNNVGVKKYSIDTILTQYNHSVLRLPPYHPDLNPIKMVWADIKADVSSQNINGNIDYVIELVKAKVDAMGPDEWQKLCAKVIELEEEYAISDHVVDDLTDQLVISSDNDSDSGSEVDTDSEEST